MSAVTLLNVFNSDVAGDSRLKTFRTSSMAAFVGVRGSSSTSSPGVDTQDCTEIIGPALFVLEHHTRNCCAHCEVFIHLMA